MQVQKTKPGYKLVKSLFGKYEEFPVIVPPKKEQDQIVAILSQADSREYELGKMKSAYKNLKKGLMQNLLTGKIRVRI